MTTSSHAQPCLGPLSSSAHLVADEDGRLRHDLALDVLQVHHLHDARDALLDVGHRLPGREPRALARLHLQLLQQRRQVEEWMAADALLWEQGG